MDLKYVNKRQLKFILTSHSEKRMLERGIPNPNSISCKDIKCVTGGSRVGKLLKTLDDGMYYFSTHHHTDVVYVCKRKTENLFLVITAYYLWVSLETN